MFNVVSVCLSKMTCDIVFVFLLLPIFLGNVMAQPEIVPLFGDCGKTLTAATGTVATPTVFNSNLDDVCTFLFTRPKTERIYIGPFEMNRTECCFEIKVYAGMTNTSSVVMTFTRKNGNEIAPQPVPTNTNTVLVTFRRLKKSFESPPVRIYHFSRGPPDNKGSRFAIADGNLFYVSTLKSQDVNVHVRCPDLPIKSFSVSVGQTYVLQNMSPESMREGPQYLEYSGGISIEAEDDIIIYRASYYSKPNPFITMPSDVLGTEYRVISVDQYIEHILIIGTEDIVLVNLTFPECKGNCSTYPDCAQSNLHFTLLSCQRVVFSCPANITGIMITSSSAISVMIKSTAQVIQLPPVNTWGKMFILTAMPGKLKVIAKNPKTNISIECYKIGNNAVEITLSIFLQDGGDYDVVTIPTATNCWISSNKPILPLHLIRTKSTQQESALVITPVSALVITPVEQYSTDYILPAEFCDSSMYVSLLILVIKTNALDGLRMNGVRLPAESEHQTIGMTGYSNVYINITSSYIQHIVRHVEPNVVFGAFQLCVSKFSVHAMPLGMRMAPIAEECEPSVSIPGDGVDNNCDGSIDEGTCNQQSDLLNTKNDCATNTPEIVPCIGYTDSKGYKWQTTSPNKEIYQPCLKIDTGLLGNMVLPDTNVKIGNFRLPTIKDTFNSGKQSFNFPTEGDIFNPGIQETIFNSGIQQDIFNTSNAGNIFNSVVDILKSVTSTDLLKTLTSLLSQLNLGIVSNFCELRDGINGVWRGPDTSLCINEGLSLIYLKLNLTLNGTFEEALEDILNEMLVTTNRLLDNDDFSAGSLRSLVNSLDTVTDIFEKRATGINAPERENFISLVDRALSTRTSPTWSMLHSKVNTSNHAAFMMNVVTRFGRQLLDNQTEKGVIYVRENIVLEARQASIDDVIFPNDTAITDINLVKNTTFNAHLFLSKDTIKNNLAGSVDYTATYYKTLDQLLPYIVEKSVFMMKETLVPGVSESLNSGNLGSDIVAFSLPKNIAADNLYPPVQLRFDLMKTNRTNATCCFWDFDLPLGGGWSTEGCYAEYTNSTYLSCRCNHLTNFAVLMSASTFTETETLVLTFITWPGCIISIICLLLTMFLYVYFWRTLKSDKSMLLLCLCVVLLLAYIILLAGINQTSNPTSCAAIAVVLHYLFLSALGLMVAEGIEIALTILPAFPQKNSNIVRLLCFGLVPPALIVIISMAATKLNGYGTDKYCWLSVSNGLIYAFLVPCIVAVLTNITITVLVIRRMFSTRAMMKKELEDKIRAGARSIAVLAPILGLTWLFGVLAVDNHLMVFSYLFTIFNSLQGLFIFIFHCLMNVKMQQAVKRQRDRFAETHPWVKPRKKTEVTTTSDTIVSSKTTKTTTA